MQSEMWVLSSRSLAERVSRRLRLDGDPEFNRDLGGDADAAEAHTRVIDLFMKRLDVEPQENSRVISVTFRAEKPERAAEIVNTLTNEYLLAGLEAKFEATQRTSVWLGSRVAELQGKVEKAESNVEELRRRYGLVAGTGGTLSAQELAELNTQLITARAARAEAQARLRHAKTLARPGAASPPLPKCSTRRSSSACANRKPSCAAGCRAVVGARRAPSAHGPAPRRGGRPAGQDR